MKWYVVQTKSRQERTAQTNIEKAGVETFSPLLKRTKSVRRSHLGEVGPLFPGYLFARFELKLHFRAVKFAQGVRDLVAFGASPATIDDQIIESIKSRVQNGYITLNPSGFIPGQAVKILEGPFQGVQAVFEREMDDHKRIILLMRTLSYQAHVVVDMDAVANL